MASFIRYIDPAEGEIILNRDTIATFKKINLKENGEETYGIDMYYTTGADKNTIWFADSSAREVLYNDIKSELMRQL